MLIPTTFDLDERVSGALRAGAGGFLLKDVPAVRLVVAADESGLGTPADDGRSAARGHG